MQRSCCDCEKKHVTRRTDHKSVEPKANWSIDITLANRETVQSVRDPDSGAAPKITVTGRALDSLAFEVSGSPALINEVKRCLA
jgi:hypothetical protein